MTTYIVECDNCQKENIVLESQTAYQVDDKVNLPCECMDPEERQMRVMTIKEIRS